MATSRSKSTPPQHSPHFSLLPSHFFLLRQIYMILKAHILVKYFDGAITPLNHMIHVANHHPQVNKA
uniref:Uncharacterized protein n=1 Tax=Cucumis melo TaxID=3656 RepID=A0A9I9E4V9_CUCME